MRLVVQTRQRGVTVGGSNPLPLSDQWLRMILLFENRSAGDVFSVLWVERS